MLSIMLKKRRIVIGIICAVVLGLVILLPKGLVFLASMKSSINSETEFFYIKEPLTLAELANRLEKEGFISNKTAFISVGEYKGIAPNEIGAAGFASTGLFIKVSKLLSDACASR